MIQARTLERFISKSPEIARKAGTKPEIARRVIEAMGEEIKNNRRQPREPAPEGSISLRAASRKYGIPNTTISYWARRKYIKILKCTSNWLYLNESSLIKYLKNRNNHR